MFSIFDNIVTSTSDFIQDKIIDPLALATTSNDDGIEEEDVEYNFLNSITLTTSSSSKKELKNQKISLLVDKNNNNNSLNNNYIYSEDLFQFPSSSSSSSSAASLLSDAVSNQINNLDFSNIISFPDNSYSQIKIEKSSKISSSVNTSNENDLLDFFPLCSNSSSTSSSTCSTSSSISSFSSSAVKLATNSKNLAKENQFSLIPPPPSSAFSSFASIPSHNNINNLTDFPNSSTTTATSSTSSSFSSFTTSVDFLLISPTSNQKDEIKSNQIDLLNFDSTDFLSNTPSSNILPPPTISTTLFNSSTTTTSFFSNSSKNQIARENKSGSKLKFHIHMKNNHENLFKQISNDSNPNYDSKVSSPIMTSIFFEEDNDTFNNNFRNDMNKRVNQREEENEIDNDWGNNVEENHNRDTTEEKKSNMFNLIDFNELANKENIKINLKNKKLNNSNNIKKKESKTNCILQSPSNITSINSSHFLPPPPPPPVLQSFQNKSILPPPPSTSSSLSSSFSSISNSIYSYSSPLSLLNQDISSSTPLIDQSHPSLPISNSSSESKIDNFSSFLSTNPVDLFFDNDDEEDDENDDDEEEEKKDFQKNNIEINNSFNSSSMTYNNFQSLSSTFPTTNSISLLSSMAAETFDLMWNFQSYNSEERKKFLD